MRTLLYIFAIIVLIVSAYAIQEETGDLTPAEFQELLNKPTSIRWSGEDEPLVTVTHRQAYGELWTYLPTKEDYAERLQAREDFYKEYDERVFSNKEN